MLINVSDLQSRARAIRSTCITIETMLIYVFFYVNICVFNVNIGVFNVNIGVWNLVQMSELNTSVDCCVQTDLLS